MDAERAATLVFLALMLVSNVSAGQATLRGPQQVPFGTDLIVEAIHIVDGAALDNVVVSVNSSGNRIDIVQTATVLCPRPGSASAFSEVNLGRMQPGTYSVNATFIAMPVGTPDPSCASITRNASLLISVLPGGGTVQGVPAIHGPALLLLALMVALAALVRLGNRRRA
jgi:hypothetical protein